MITITRNYNPWLTSEVAKLRRIFRTAIDSELVTEFPRHTLASIKNMAMRQRLKKGNSRTDTMRKYREIAARHVPTFNFGGAGS